MENNKPENPNAFPSINQYTGDLNPGMSLRDYFAAKALQGILTANHPHFWGNRDGEIEPNYAAETSYKMADAMLQEREK